MPKTKNRGVKTLTQLYLEEIGRIPLLSAKEERALAKRIEAGDDKARQKLIRANLRLVVSIAKRFDGRSLTLTLLGLIQEGNLGLLRAVKKFDWRINCKFSTFAYPRIRGHILDALCDDSRRIIGFSFDEPLSEGGKNLHSIVEDKKAVSPSAAADSSFLPIALEKAMSGLKPREQWILRMLFGLEDGVAHGVKEIAEELGISGARIRQIRDGALETLRSRKKVIQLQ